MDGTPDNPHDHGHSHSHSIDDDRPFGVRLAALASRRVLFSAVVAIAIATFVGLVLLWPGAPEPITNFEGESFFGERVEAKVFAARLDTCSYSELGDVNEQFCYSA